MFLQIVTTAVPQIDWTPYVLAALGGLALLFGKMAVSDLKARVKQIEDDRREEEKERNKRNEKISERISSIELDTSEALGDIREKMAKILK